LVCRADGQALIIDPGSDAETISGILKDRHQTPLAVFNTHAHYDHVGAIAALVEEFGIPFYLHGDDAELLRRANLYRMVFDSPEIVRIPQVTYDFRDMSSVFEIGHFQIEILHTPGHTPGSVCIRLDNHLFSGDTLMKSGAGRTDLPGGDSEALQKSIKLLSLLDGDIQVFSGHGRSVMLSDALAADSLLSEEVK